MISKDYVFYRFRKSDIRHAIYLLTKISNSLIYGTDLILNKVSATLNVNLNLPGVNFSGSGVRFFDQETQEVSEVTFAPGTALMHHGSVPHDSMPITEGERSNLVLWLYGESGQVARPGIKHKRIDAKQRWTVPTVQDDGFAPF